MTNVIKKSQKQFKVYLQTLFTHNKRYAHAIVKYYRFLREKIISLLKENGVSGVTDINHHTNYKRKY